MPASRYSAIAPRWFLQWLLPFQYWIFKKTSSKWKHDRTIEPYRPVVLLRGLVGARVRHSRNHLLKLHWLPLQKSCGNLAKNEREQQRQTRIAWLCILSCVGQLTSYIGPRPVSLWLLRSTLFWIFLLRFGDESAVILAAQESPNVAS